MSNVVRFVSRKELELRRRTLESLRENINCRREQAEFLRRVFRSRRSPKGGGASMDSDIPV
jgi:hypothetical protein